MVPVRVYTYFRDMKQGEPGYQVGDLVFLMTPMDHAAWTRGHLKWGSVTVYGYWDPKARNEAGAAYHYRPSANHRAIVLDSKIFGDVTHTPYIQVLCLASRRVAWFRARDVHIVQRL